MKKVLIVNFLDKQQWANEVPYLWLSLRSYFIRNSKNPSAWHWLDPLYSSYAESVTEIVNNIVSQTPDVIGISCYVWNEKLTLFVANEVKKQLPSVKIVAGGPGIYLDQNRGWFNQHPYIDAVCEYTGYGEVFMTEYLDGTCLENIPFCVYPVLGGLYWNKSSASFNKKELKFSMPYTDNQEYLTRFKSKHSKIKLLLETSRGCPYSCTFCEWGFSNSKKLVFRDVDEIYADLEVAFKVLEPMAFDIIDSNFGIVSKNIDVARKIADLNLQHNQCLKFVELGGPTKVKKENLKIIYEILLGAGIDIDFKIAIQHTDVEVLDNIERVETDLSSQLEIFKPLIDTSKVDLKIEAILGLPGDTIDKFYQMMDEMTVHPSLEPWCHQWVMLPGTPASDSAYIEKMQIQTKQFTLNADASEYDCINQVIPKDQFQNKVFKQGNRRLILDQEWTPVQHLVISTYSYTPEEWVEMNLSFIYISYLRYNKITVPIVVYLREKGVNLKDFYKMFFREFLMSIELLRRAYDTIIIDINRNDVVNFEFINIGPNFPYISNRALLKFVILLSPNEFFTRLLNWLENKYGKDEYLTLVCNSMSSAIKSPGNLDIPLHEKIKECLIRCQQIIGEDNKLLPTTFKITKD